MNKFLLTLLISFTFPLCLAQSKAMGQTIRYIKQNATGGGTSWNDASGDFQAMINESASGNEVWVAAVTYQPSANNSFFMKEGVKIYGGFTGTETLLSQRISTESQYALSNSADPFVNSANPAGVHGKWVTADDGLQVSACSPAVNTSKNKNIPEGTSFDITGNPRKFGDGVV